MTVSINGTSGIVNDATDLNYTGTLTGGTGVVNLGSGQVYKDASGNVGIGTISPSSYGKLHVRGVQNIGTYGNVSGSFSDGATGSLYVQHSSGLVQLGSDTALSFGTGSSATERARIDSSGNLLVGTTSANGKITASTAVTNNYVLSAASTSASYAGVHIVSTSAATAGTNWYHFVGYSSNAATNNIFIYGNGNIVNANNSYGAFSDVKLKENIVDATPKLDKLNQVRIVNYNLIGDEQKQLGVIAQELEQIFPGMVEDTPDRDEEGNDLGTTTKSVKYSVFVPMLIKAIQEQQTTIVSLQDTLTALTARITALEGTAA